MKIGIQFGEQQLQIANLFLVTCYSHHKRLHPVKIHNPDTDIDGTAPFGQNDLIS